MQIEIVDDVEWIRRNHDGIRRPDRIIDTIGYKLATLNDSFYDIHAIKSTSIIPLCRWNGRLEMIGQFWSEGWDSALPAYHWDAVMQTTGPFWMQYSRYQVSKMTADPAEQAYLSLPETEQCRYYESLFQTSDERRVLRQAFTFKETTTIEMAEQIGKSDIDLLVALSAERIGNDSYLLDDLKRKSFVGVVEYLQGINSLEVLKYHIRGEVVGIAFLMYDVQCETLTFLSGFYRNRLNNFGKFMYWSFAKLAECVGAREIVALAPLSRIKRDMMYQGRGLYGYSTP